MFNKLRASWKEYWERYNTYYLYCFKCREFFKSHCPYEDKNEEDAHLEFFKKHWHEYGHVYEFIADTTLWDFFKAIDKHWQDMREIDKKVMDNLSTQEPDEE